MYSRDKVSDTFIELICADLTLLVAPRETLLQIFYWH